MAYIKFIHHDGKHDMVSFKGLQDCLDRGVVKEFYTPFAKQWVDPLRDAIRNSSEEWVAVEGEDRRWNNHNNNFTMMLTKRS